MAPKKVPVPRDVDEIEIPSEFPDGFGHSASRATLSVEQRNYLQKSWDALEDNEKARAMLALRQHVPQVVPHAPHRMAS